MTDHKLISGILGSDVAERIDSRVGGSITSPGSVQKFESGKVMCCPKCGADFIGDFSLQGLQTDRKRWSCKSEQKAGCKFGQTDCCRIRELTRDLEAVTAERDCSIKLLVKSIGPWYVLVGTRRMLNLESGKWTIRNSYNNESVSFDSMLDAIRAAMKGTNESISS